jgi:hypothetical protein
MIWAHHPVADLMTTYADTWQQVNEQFLNAHPLLDLDFVAPLVDHFGNNRLLLAVEKTDGEFSSLAIVERKRPGLWQLFLPSQAQIAPSLIGIPATGINASQRTEKWLRSLPGPALMISLQNQDTDFSGVAGDEAETIEILPHVTTVGVTIEGTFEDYWHGRSAQLQENIARRLKRAEKEGMRISFQVQSSGSALGAAVAAHGDIECAGWKKRAGTAIHRDNIQGRFYTDVLQRFAARGGARAFQLYFGDVLVASQLAIEQNGMMVLLKTAHREAFARHSPGRLLDYMMFRHLFSESQLKRVEYYTNASPEDMRWATFSRPIVHVNVYRSTAVRKLCAAIRGYRSRAAVRHAEENQLSVKST